MPRYYCDYCDVYLTHDSPSVRKQHNSGYKHKAAVRVYYQQFEEQETQSLVDQKVQEYLQRGGGQVLGQGNLPIIARHLPSRSQQAPLPGPPGPPRQAGAPPPSFRPPGPPSFQPPGAPYRPPGPPSNGSVPSPVGPPGAPGGYGPGPGSAPPGQGGYGQGGYGGGYQNAGAPPAGYNPYGNSGGGSGGPMRGPPGGARQGAPSPYARPGPPTGSQGPPGTYNSSGMY